MERYYTLHLNGDTNYQIAEWPAPPTMRNDIQFRSDMAREYQVEPGEGYFCVWEDGKVVNKLDIPG